MKQYASPDSSVKLIMVKRKCYKDDSARANPVSILGKMAPKFLTSTALDTTFEITRNKTPPVNVS